jgi:carbon monoxide dehydrogenase subunit G
MKIEGSYEFEAPRRLVWEMLLDPAVLGKSMPGCQTLEQVGDDKLQRDGHHPGRPRARSISGYSQAV